MSKVTWVRIKIKFFFILGCSRDIGAALTRFCLRQKSLENLIRSLANALSDQFVISVEKKAAEWKLRVSEIERQRNRALKKSKQQKKYGDGTENSADHKNRYVEVLNEQRGQFVYFVNALLPILVIKFLNRVYHMTKIWKQCHFLDLRIISLNNSPFKN